MKHCKHFVGFIGLLAILLYTHIATATPPPTHTLLDSFADSSNWVWGSFDNSLTPSFGSEVNTVELDYSFTGTEDYVFFKKIYGIPRDICDLGLIFDIKTEGDINDLEIKWVDTDGSNFNTVIESVSAATYQTISLKSSDFSYLFGGDTELNKIASFEILIRKRNGGSGKIYLKDLNRSLLYDDFATPAYWQTSTHNSATILPVYDIEDNGVALNYTFNDGDYVNYFKVAGMISDIPDISIDVDVKTTGTINDLEFQWIDTDGSIFSYTEENADYIDYQTITISADQFVYIGGGDTKLDTISQLNIRINNVNGGGGAIYIKNLFLDTTSTGTPIAISTPQELQDMNLNRFADYYLTNNIDCSTFTNFEPIGPFGGTLDGQNYKISNLSINKQYIDYTGLFSSTINATIKNIGLENITVNGGNRTGALVGENDSSLIQNCYATGSIVASQNNGMLVGASYVGGLIGYNNKSTVSDSYSKVTVSALENPQIGGNYNGGFIGSNKESSIENCFSTGTVNSSGQYTGGAFVGGFIGYNNKSTVKTSYATGETIASGNVGGFIGLCGNYSTIEDCYARGNVTGKGARGFGTHLLGGFMGQCNDSTVTNCYSTGRAVAWELTVVGFVGVTNNTTYAYNFWDYESAGANPLDDTFDGSIAGITSKTSAEMAIQATFTNWNFSTEWIMLGNGYPHLKQLPLTSFAVFTIGADDSSDLDFQQSNYNLDFYPDSQDSTDCPKELNLTWYQQQYFHFELTQFEVENGISIVFDPCWNDGSGALTIAIDAFIIDGWKEIDTVEVNQTQTGTVDIQPGFLKTGFNDFRFRAVSGTGGTTVITWDQIKCETIPRFFKWELGTNDQSDAEFDQSNFDLVYDVDLEPVSEFPKELNNSWYTAQYIHFLVVDNAFTRKEGELCFDVLWSDGNGELTITLEYWDGNNWTEIGETALSGHQAGSIRIPPYILYLGTNAWRLTVTDATGGTTAVVWDYIALL